MIPREAFEQALPVAQKLADTKNKSAVISNMNLLANGARLVSEVVVEVAGDNITNKLGNRLIDRNTVTGMALAVFNRELCAGSSGEQGIELGVAAGSPMQDLLEHCNPYGIHANGGSFEDIDLDTAIQYLVAESSFARADNVVEHSRAMTRCLELTAPAVRRSIDYARNVVVPEINSILDKVDSAVRGVMAQRREPFTVVPVVVPNLLRNSSLVEMAQRYSEMQIQSFKSAKVVEFSPANVLELLKTGASDFDADVDDMVGEGKNYYWFLDLLTDFFRGGCGMDAIPTYCQPLLFVVARAMYDNPPVGCLMGLADYNNYISQVLAQSGRNTFAAINAAANDRRMKRLYVAPQTQPGTNNQPGSIYVNADVWSDLANEGVSAEMLYANEANGRFILPIDLVANKDRLQEIYNQMKTSNERLAQLEEFNVVKAEIQKVLEEAIRTRSEENMVVDRTVYTAALKEAMTMVMPHRMKCLSSLVRDLVCAVFHRHTDAIRYLSLIDEIGDEKKDKGEETVAREIALLATIEYLSIWVCRQFLK